MYQYWQTQIPDRSKDNVILFGEAYPKRRTLRRLKTRTLANDATAAHLWQYGRIWDGFEARPERMPLLTIRGRFAMTDSKVLALKPKICALYGRRSLFLLCPSGTNTSGITYELVSGDCYI
jgi:hypothetical protein